MLRAIQKRRVCGRIAPLRAHGQDHRYDGVDEAANKTVRRLETQTSVYVVSRGDISSTHKEIKNLQNAWLAVPDLRLIWRIFRLRTPNVQPQLGLSVVFCG